MKVREFLDVINFNMVDYAQIYEMIWDEDYQDYYTKTINKRVNSKKDLEPYLDYELDYFNYETQWVEFILKSPKK